MKRKRAPYTVRLGVELAVAFAEGSITQQQLLERIRPVTRSNLGFWLGPRLLEAVRSGVLIRAQCMPQYEIPAETSKSLDFTADRNGKLLAIPSSNPDHGGHNE